MPVYAFLGRKHVALSVHLYVLGVWFYSGACGLQLVAVLSSQVGRLSSEGLGVSGTASCLRVSGIDTIAPAEHCRARNLYTFLFFLE